MTEGVHNGHMWNTTKRVSDAKPSDTQLLIAPGLTNQRFQDIRVLITTLRGSSAFLFLRQDANINGPPGQTFSNDAHKQLINAGHQSNWTKVTDVSGVSLLIDKDSKPSFPEVRNVLGSETRVEDKGQDLCRQINTLSGGHIPHDQHQGQCWQHIGASQQL